MKSFKAHCVEVDDEKNNCIKWRENTSHVNLIWRNDSPQRSCASLALGLPTTRGGWQGPGGTAGVWTCRVSDSLQGKTRDRLKDKLPVSPLSVYLSGYILVPANHTDPETMRMHCLNRQLLIEFITKLWNMLDRLSGEQKIDVLKRLNCE